MTVTQRYRLFNYTNEHILKALLLFIAFFYFIAIATARADSETGHALQSATVSLLKERQTTPVSIALFGGTLLPEGTDWSSSQAIQLNSIAQEIDIELPESTAIEGLVLQADANDAYIVESSADRQAWQPLWVAPKTFGVGGLRTRVRRVQTTTKFLRIRPGDGDGYFSVARLLVLPAPWGAEISQFQQHRYAENLFMLTPGIKYFLVIVGAIFGAIALYSGARRISYSVLALCATIAIPLWWNLGTFHRGEFVHAWDFAHYYIGAKYFDELGYTRLYLCAAQADLEAGVIAQQDDPLIRDLVSNTIMPLSKLPDKPAQCHSYFTDARWRTFSADIAWVREHMAADRWSGWRKDHGFNATPVWILLGRTITNLVPLGIVNNIKLAAIDAAYLLGMWAVVWWGFGWRVLSFAAIYWGTVQFAGYYWSGGSLLRYDWLFFVVSSVALLRRGFPALSGAALAYSALLRIFPILFLAPWILVVLRRRTLGAIDKHFLIGFIAATVALLAVTVTVLPSGFAALGACYRNLEKHRNTPLTNDIGVPFLLSFNIDTRGQDLADSRAADPYELWKEKQRETFSGRKVIYILLLALYAAPFLLRRSNLQPWELLALGATAVPMLTNLTCYYYGFLLTLGLLAETATVPPLCLLTLGMLSFACDSWFPAFDEQFALWSLFLLIACLTIVWTSRHARSARPTTTV